MSLKIKDIFIGKTDAKNELIECSDQEIHAFKSGFLMPDNVIAEDFFSGKRYFIIGLKGTGKTALLRYLGICVDELEGCHSSFILFKSDIKEDKRSALESIANVIQRGQDSYGGFKDFEQPWKLFLFQQIVSICEEKEIQLFQEDDYWKEFRKHILATENLNKKPGSLFPKVTHGKVSLDVKYIKAEMDLEFDKDAIKEIDFDALISDCEDLFKHLTPRGEKLYLFIDEMELTLGTEAQYQRDVDLIRDLILSIDWLNRTSRLLKFPIYCITGIRQEVLDATQSTGKEINKPISDFGVSLRWQQFSEDDARQPLIKIIIKRLMCAEEVLPEKERATEETVWERYFPAMINQKPIRKYILDQTWYRPRDIVRILGKAQELFPNEEFFSEEVFTSINKNYSVDSWTEQEEELRTKYSKNDIKGIKHLLMGISIPFTYDEFIKRAEELREKYDNVNSVLLKYKAGDILSHLFRLGIIGNSSTKAKRFSFRGDEDLLIEKPMMVHRALWNVLSIGKKSKKESKAFV